MKWRALTPAHLCRCFGRMAGSRRLTGSRHRHRARPVFTRTGYFWFPNEVPHWRPWRRWGISASGYSLSFRILITTLLMQELEKNGAISLKGFYLRRFLRICPAFYAYIWFIVLAASSRYVLLEKGDLLHALTYTMNYHNARSWWLGHLWSLSVEEQFFSAAHPGLWGPPQGAPGVVAVRRIVSSHQVLDLVSAAPGYIGEYFNMLADTLAVGCVLALSRAWLARQPMYLRIFDSRVVIGAIPVIILITNFLLPHTRFSWLCGETVLNISIAAGIDWCIRNYETPFGKILNRQPMVAIGVLSYSIYLWQQPFLNPGARWWPSTFPVNMILAAGAALLSYLCVERPFLMLPAGSQRTRSRLSP